MFNHLYMCHCWFRFCFLVTPTIGDLCSILVVLYKYHFTVSYKLHLQFNISYRCLTTFTCATVDLCFVFLWHQPLETLGLKQLVCLGFFSFALERGSTFSKNFWADFWGFEATFQLIIFVAQMIFVMVIDCQVIFSVYFCLLKILVSLYYYYVSWTLVDC